MRCQICLQPLSLRRIAIAASYLGTIRIECNYMPFAQIVAVVAALGIACGCTKIAKIGSSSRCDVFMVPHDGATNGFELTPSAIVGFLKSAGTSYFILQIPQGQNSRQLFTG